MKQLNRNSLFLLLVIFGQSITIQTMEAEITPCKTDIINDEIKAIIDNYKYRSEMDKIKRQRELDILFETDMVKENPAQFVEYLDKFDDIFLSKYRMHRAYGTITDQIFKECLEEDNKLRDLFEYVADYKYQGSWWLPNIFSSRVPEYSLFEECLSKQNLPAIALLTRNQANLYRKIDCHIPLTLACYRNYSSIAMILINAGVNVNISAWHDYSHQPTALHYLVNHCDRDALTVATKLIEKGADVNAKNIFCATPLGLAARSGNFPMIQLFLTQAEVSAATISSALQESNRQCPNIEIRNLLTAALAAKSNNGEKLPEQTEPVTTVLESNINPSIESKINTNDDWSWKDSF